MRFYFNFNRNFTNTNNQDSKNNKPPKFGLIMIIIGFTIFVIGMMINIFTFGRHMGLGLPFGFIVAGIGFGIAFIGIITNIITSAIKGSKLLENLPNIEITNADTNSEKKEETTGYEVFRCPSCGAVIDHDAKECNYCGSDVREKKN